MNTRPYIPGDPPHRESGQRDALARYVMAGALATASHYGLMLLLIRHYEFQPMFSTLLGSMLGLIVGHQLNHRWTFRSRQPATRTGWRFVVVAVCGMLVNLLVFGLGSGLGLGVPFAQIGATLATFVFGYALNRSWTFRQPAP